jgi:selenocysteine-specific elongation factor
MYVIGTAGHIDHGKTALIHALTGIDADRLPEEKKRGMTIDLGFAWMALPSGEKVGIVDVPGHENFVKNMIVGATGIDAVILVIDAHEGWMPQTEEHFQIIQLLDITQGVIAITKIDMVEKDQLEIIESKIRERLKDTAFSDSRIVKVNSVKKIGIDELKIEIQKLLPQIKPKKDIQKPRLCIDRVFNIKGSGTVVTGTLIGGKLTVNQEVIIFPHMKKIRIRSIQTYKEQVSEASPGTRVATNLAGVKKEDLKRGDIIFGYEPIKSSRYIDIKLDSIPNLSNFKFKSGMILDFIWETKEISAQIILGKAQAETEKETKYCQVRLKENIATFIGDHFILRRPTPALTVGGGIILDPLAEKHSFNDEYYSNFLDSRKNLGLNDLIFSELEKLKFSLLNDFLIHSNYSFSEISASIQSLKNERKLVLADLWVIDYLYWEQQKNKLIELLKKEYQKNPLEKNIPVNTLQSKYKYLPSKLFLSLIQSLANLDKIMFTDGKISIPDYSPSISPERQKVINSILELFRDNPKNPPTEKIIYEQYQNSQEIIRYLIKDDIIVKLDEGILMDKKMFNESKEQIVSFIKGSSSITINEARDILGMSRKYIIPFLERLDKEGITVRKENKRYLL